MVFPVRGFANGRRSEQARAARHCALRQRRDHGRTRSAACGAHRSGVPQSLPRRGPRGSLPQHERRGALRHIDEHAGPGRRARAGNTSRPAVSSRSRFPPCSPARSRSSGARTRTWARSRCA
uniref:Uncharacterized protein n=1 Tax=Sparassis latifolia TaxID=1202976 RepID=A0A6B9LS72_9APHY|nr:hypothetical protein [Sparassis latifolia]